MGKMVDKRMNKKGGLMSLNMGMLILGVFALVLAFGIILYLTGTLSNAYEFIKNLLRFGR